VQFVVAAVLLLVLFTACSGGVQHSDALYVAILIEDGNIEQENAFEDFRLALEEYIGMPVTMVQGLTHLVGIESMRAGRLHVMWGSPFVYLLSGQTMDVERLVVTSSPNALNKGVFITGQEDIHCIDDLVGRTFSFTSHSSASGFLYPMYYLINRHELSRDEIFTPGVLFRDVAFSGGNNPTIVGVAQGDYDGGVVGYLQLSRAISAGVIAADAIRIIGYTPNIPFPGYIARTDLPEELRGQIQGFLMRWDSDSYSAARFNDAAVRYALPSVAEIEYLRSMVHVLGIDLEEQG
jgi:phosphonate transport system substrate-binding protein